MENNQKYCTIYIVRHGQAQANIDKIVAGTTDTPLTKEGESQAKLRALEFANIKFDAAFSSDLVRAHRTAQIITLEKQLAVSTRKILRERHFGQWEGKPEENFFNDNAHLLEKIKMLSESEKQEFKFDADYESNEEIASRFITFLREIAVTYIGKTVLVVSHGSMMRSVLMHLGFGTYESIPHRAIDNTGYFVLESDGVDFFVKEAVGVNKVEII